MRYGRWLGWAILACSVAVASSTSAAGRCRGTKVPYGGRCVYPSQLAALKRAAQRKRTLREKARREKAEREKAEREKAEREKAEREKAEREKARREKAEGDATACATARKKKKRLTWQSYLEQHPEGGCRDEAKKWLAAKATTDLKQKKNGSNTQPSKPNSQAQRGPLAAPAKPSGTSPAKTNSSPRMDSRSSSVSPWVWVGFGTAAAFGIAGGILGGLSFAESKDLQQKCPNNLCSPGLMDDVDSMRLKGHLSTAALAVAGAGAVVGVLGLVLKPSPSPSSNEQASRKHQATALHWQLGMGPGHLHLRLRY